MSEAKITQEELHEWFGDSMPIEAVLLCASREHTLNQIRDELQRMAKTPKSLAVRALNIYSHHVAEAITDDTFDEFSTQERAMEKVVEFVIRECCPRKR